VKTNSFLLLSVVALAACPARKPAGSVLDGGDAGTSTAGDLDAGRLDAGPERVDLLRDAFGVPHIYADSTYGAAYGWGWSESEDQRSTILFYLYGGAGRATARFGPSCTSCIAVDFDAMKYGVPGAVALGYAQLEPLTRDVLEGYAAGVNAFYAQFRPASTVWSPTDPVTAQMVAGSLMLLRIWHAQEVSGIMPTGSNQFVVGGQRAFQGVPVSEKDPHNLWSSSEPYLHLRIGQLDIVGNAFLGSFSCGATSHLTFGCTRAGATPGARVRARVRSIGAVDAGSRCGPHKKYEAFDHRANAGDGGFVPLDARCIDIDPAVDGGRWLFSSRFGPVEQWLSDGGIEEVEFGQLFAAADVSTVDYDVGLAFRTSVNDFLSVFRAATPREDSRYRAVADSAGNIGFVLGAAIPELDAALTWSQPVSSADSRIDSWTPFSDWSRFTGVTWHNLDGRGLELPHTVNPVGDFVQNCNGNPGWATEPPGQVGAVPAFAERNASQTQREERLRELLLGATAMTLDQAEAVAIDIKVNTGEHLVEALRCRVTADALDPVALYGEGGRLMQLLLGWRAASGYRAEPGSVEMTVLYLFDAASNPGFTYPLPGACFSRAELDAVGGDLRDSVVPYMRSRYAAVFADPLRVPWSYVNSVRVAGAERGIPGGAGTTGRLSTLFTSAFQLDVATGRARVGGWRVGTQVPQVSTWVAGKLETRISVPHGQIDDFWYPSTPHLGQTIEAFVARRMRKVWLDRADVEANLCPFGVGAESHEHRSILSLVPTR
jgi:hypothetical protein